MTVWQDAGFLVVDFETTDANPRQARPLSAGWVAIVNGRIRVADGGYTLIASDGEVPVASMPFHRLLPEDVAAGTTPADVGSILTAVLDGRTLVAHGAWLELAMLRRLGVRWPRNETVDTMQLAREVEGEHGHRDLTLTALARRYELPVPRAHHAFGDALATAQLLLALVARLGARRSPTVDDLRRLARPR
ncbi:3'-5' exonuclease [Egibacter rhizosphaerae]|uniref:3'-5' exonuclease n=1 Tax=Egibacter rhizosphaerae TaxID=1670831 RepID=UPI0013F14AFC|nr:3'-5' exonuclease [Egibacter rhizosphaerae]